MPAIVCDELIKQMERELTRVDQYERLARRQEKLIFRGEFEKLHQVLDQKDKILEQIEKMENEFRELKDRRVPGKRGDSDYQQSMDRMLGELKVRLETVLEHERASMAMALEHKEGLARQLRSLYHGKKLLHGYVRGPSDGKARFKDIKT